MGTDIEGYRRESDPFIIWVGTVEGHENRCCHDVMACLAGVRGEEEWGVECIQDVSDAVCDVLMVLGRRNVFCEFGVGVGVYVEGRRVEAL